MLDESDTARRTGCAVTGPRELMWNDGIEGLEPSKRVRRLGFLLAYLSPGSPGLFLSRKKSVRLEPTWFELNWTIRTDASPPPSTLFSGVRLAPLRRGFAFAPISAQAPSPSSACDVHVAGLDARHQKIITRRAAPISAMTKSNCRRMATWRSRRFL